MDNKLINEWNATHKQYLLVASVFPYFKDGITKEIWTLFVYKNKEKIWECKEDSFTEAYKKLMEWTESLPEKYTSDLTEGDYVILNVSGKEYECYYQGELEDAIYVKLFGTNESVQIRKDTNNIKISKGDFVSILYITTKNE